jgi:glutathione S-transferase
MIANLFIFVLCVTSISNVLSFSSWNKLATRTGSSLSMAGGRSPAEKGKSVRTMYKEVRNLINDRALDPAFFETGAKPDIELYCKSNNDGSQIGDCPFAQFVQLVLQKKGLMYNIHPTLATDKPAFLVEKHEGKMPCLVHKGESMTDSLAIAEFLEKMYPEPNLSRAGLFSYSEVMQKTSGFFPALSAYIKNKDETVEESLKADISAQLDIIDEVLRSSPGKYLCGIEMSLADLYLTPQLFHAYVTMDHFKGIDYLRFGAAEMVRPALEMYAAKMFDLPEFNNKRAYYNCDAVVNGWKKARGD